MRRRTNRRQADHLIRRAKVETVGAAVRWELEVWRGTRLHGLADLESSWVRKIEQAGRGSAASVDLRETVERLGALWRDHADLVASGNRRRAGRWGDPLRRAEGDVVDAAVKWRIGVGTVGWSDWNLRRAVGRLNDLRAGREPRRTAGAAGAAGAVSVTI